MERLRRDASKITNYRTFHLSGGLDTQLKGKVGRAISHIKDMSNQSKLEQQLQEQIEANKKLEEQAAEMRIRNEMEEQQCKAKALELSITHMKEARDAALAAHQKNMAELDRIAEEARNKTEIEAQAWLEEQVKMLKTNFRPNNPVEEAWKKEEEEKEKKIKELGEQLQLTGEQPSPIKEEPQTQQVLIQQLKAALDSKSNTDPQQDIL